MILLILVVGKPAKVSICPVRLCEKEGLVGMGEEKERVPSPSLFHLSLPLFLPHPLSPPPPSSIIPSFSLPHIISLPPSPIIPLPPLPYCSFSYSLTFLHHPSLFCTLWYSPMTLARMPWLSSTYVHLCNFRCINPWVNPPWVGTHVPICVTHEIRYPWVGGYG